MSIPPNNDLALKFSSFSDIQVAYFSNKKNNIIDNKSEKIFLTFKNLNIEQIDKTHLQEKAKEGNIVFRNSKTGKLIFHENVTQTLDENQRFIVRSPVIPKANQAFKEQFGTVGSQAEEYEEVELSLKDANVIILSGSEFQSLTNAVLLRLQMMQMQKESKPLTDYTFKSLNQNVVTKKSANVPDTKIGKKNPKAKAEGSTQKAFLEEQKDLDKAHAEEFRRLQGILSKFFNVQAKNDAFRKSSQIEE